MRITQWLKGRNSVSPARSKSSRLAGFETPAYAIPPSRQGRRAVTTWQAEAAVRQLKALALEQGWTQQRAVAEALNLLFVRCGKPTIAN